MVSERVTVFGFDRRAIAQHARSCLTDERRTEVLADFKGEEGKL